MIKEYNRLFLHLLNAFALAMFCPADKISAQTGSVLWGDEIIVSTENFYITAPRAALLPDGEPLVVWGVSGNPNKIWVSRLSQDTFSAPVQVPTDPYVPTLFGFAGFDLAVQDSSVFITFEQAQAGILLSRSADGGHTFEAPVVVQGSPAGGYLSLSSVSVNEAGNPLVAYIQQKGTYTWQCCRSADGGQTFLPPVEASEAAAGEAVCECCTSDLLCRGDSVWLTFRNNDNNLRDIWVSRSTDGGETFDLAADVDESDWHLNVCPISGPQIARLGDSIAIVWMSGASGTARVFANTLDGATMQAGNQVAFADTSALNAVQNQISITANGDTVGVVFQENGTDLVLAVSSCGIARLHESYSRISAPGQTLQFPVILYKDGLFHLFYVNPSLGQLLYRKGVFTPLTGSQTTENNFSGIKMFPNPASSGTELRLQGSEKEETTSATLLNTSGGIVRKWTRPFLHNAAGQATIRLDHCPDGLYFLQINAGKKVLFAKIIVQN